MKRVPENLRSSSYENAFTLMVVEQDSFSVAYRAPSWPKTFVVLACAIVCVVALDGCKREPAASGVRKPNVVLVTIDTIRADQLGCYGYFRDTSPHLDVLAGESVLFEHCIAPIATTFPSHLSMMTGLEPLEHGAIANILEGGRRYVPSDKLKMLAEIFESAGYATAAFVGATPVKRLTGLARGFQVFDEPDGPRRRAEGTNEAVFEWLDRKPSQPFFLWVHYYDPHSPYRAPAPFGNWFHREEALDKYLVERRFFSQPKGKQALGQSSDLTHARSLVNGYNGEIRYTDDQLHRLTEKLRERGVWDNSIVVVIGDHGEGMTQHGVHAHGHVWREQIEVPFLIRAPGLSPRRVREWVSIVDLAPTILALSLGTDRGFLVPEAGGRNVLDGPVAERSFLAVADGFDDNQAYIRVSDARIWKYVEIRASRKSLLFDLIHDPFELQDVSQDNAEVASSMAVTLRETIENQRATGRTFESASEPMTPEMVRQLEGLGYVDDDGEDETP